MINPPPELPRLEHDGSPIRTRTAPAPFLPAHHLADVRKGQNLEQ